MPNVKTIRYCLACLLLGGVLLGCELVSTAATKPAVVSGYVEEIVSPSGFVVSGARVLCGEDTRLATLQGDETLLKPFKLEMVRVGMHVEVTGQWDGKANEMQAARIVLTESKTNGKTVGSAVIERTPILKETADGWTGIIRADGRNLRIVSASKVEFPAPGKHKQAAPAGAAQPLSSLDQIGPNVLVSYRGREMADGSVKVEWAAFKRNEVSQAEQDMREADKPKIVAPNYAMHKAGVLKMEDPDRVFHIVPDEYLQRRATEIGMALVPAFQKALPDSDPTKIQFRFYVVEEGKKTGLRTSPDGLVLVPAKLVGALENEAQLAAVISIAVAGIEQKAAYRLGARFDLLNGAEAAAAATGAVVPGIDMVVGIFAYRNAKQYLRTLTEQLGRLELEYLLQAGWDMRQAPRAMKLAYGKRRTEAPNDKDEPLLSGYLTGEITNHYTDVDYSKLRVNENDYQKLLAAVGGSRR